MTVTNPCVAFVIHDIIHFRASLSMAAAIDSKFKIHFYFINDVLLENCRQNIPESYVKNAMFNNPIRKFNLYTATNRRVETKKRRKPIADYVYDFVRVIIPRPLRLLIWYFLVKGKRYVVPVSLWLHWLRASMFRRLLKNHRPDILVLNQSDVENMSELYLHYARRFGIKTVINPFTFCTTDSMLKHFGTYPDRSRANRLDSAIIKPLFPQWFRPHDGHVFMRTTPAEVIATGILGYRYEEPWKQDYSSADILLVDNAIALKHYQNMGFPDSQLRCIGLPEHDALAARLGNKHALYERLCAEYGLDNRLKLVVIALPPEYELGIERSEFSSFYELISFVESSFVEMQTWNVMLCQHPRSPIGDYNPSSERVRIAHQSTFDLVPLCDVYVSFVSVTIKWANFCGIPALNYDAYAMKDFAHLETDNIISVDTKAEYTKAATALCADPVYYARWKAKQKENRHLWGNTKGTAQQEMIALLQELVQ
jgi:hypothetical protein